MATVITEYKRLAVDADSNVIPLPAEPPVASTALTVSGTSQQATLTAGTQFVLITSDAALRIEIGTDPTAGSGSRIVPANVPMFFSVSGDGVTPLKIAYKTA